MTQCGKEGAASGNRGQLGSRQAAHRMSTPAKTALPLCIAIAAFATGAWWTRSTGGQKAAPGVRRILYYHDPMHPAYKSDKPGIAPDCGMQLEPVYADGGPAAPASPAGPAGTVQVSPQKQQLIGVQIGQVQKAAGTHSIRTLGRVAADETRLYRVNAAVDGWIRDISSVSTGSLVKKDQVLASFYAPEFLGPQQGYLYALDALDRFSKESAEQIALTKANIQGAVDSLRNLGMGDVQIKEMERTRRLTQNVSIMAPASGFVVSRNVSLGQRFDKGTEFYRIADLSRVWVLMDIFEDEAEYYRPGTVVRLTLPYQRKVLNGQISDILPQFDPATRTLKLRVEVDNPGYVLRPDMFVDVEFPVTLPPTLTVPVDAVLDSGRSKRVFVDRGNGFFEPRQVETGRRFDGQVEIIKGLMTGERIVTSGLFLIDSESRIKAAAAGMFGNPLKDPVCGMDVDENRAKAAGNKSDYRGKTYYFCSGGCKKQFQANPERFAGMPHPRRPAKP